MSQAQKQQPQPKQQAQLLPSRYDEILDQRLKTAREVIQQAQQSAGGKRIHWNWRYAALGLLSVILAISVGTGKDEPSKGSLPFDRAAVVSADTLGLGVQPGDFVTAAPKRSATPTPSPTPQPPRAASIVVRRPRPTPPPPPRGTSDRHEDGDEDLLLDGVAVHVPALEDLGPQRLAPGTRLAAILTNAIATGAVGSPVSAVLAEDLMQGGRVVVPIGTTLIGEAFSTRSDDRIQVVFQALVREGSSVPLRAVALGADGQVGLQGTLVRKGSKAKKGLGKVLGAVASTLTLGAVGGGGDAVGALADGLVTAGAVGLTDLERAWAMERSDKVIRVAAGTRLTAWIQTEAKIP